MKRKEFLKRIALLSGAVITAPVIASELLNQEDEISIDLDHVGYVVPTGVTITLPPARDGLHFTFVNKTGGSAIIYPSEETL